MDKLLTRPEVEAATGLRRTAIYDRIAKGTFPKALRVGPKAVRWRASEIAEWMDSLPRHEPMYDRAANE